MLLDYASGKTMQGLQTCAQSKNEVVLSEACLLHC